MQNTPRSFETEQGTKQITRQPLSDNYSSSIFVPDYGTVDSFTYSTQLHFIRKSPMLFLGLYMEERV